MPSKYVGVHPNFPTLSSSAKRRICFFDCSRTNHIHCIHTKSFPEPALTLTLKPFSAVALALALVAPLAAHTQEPPAPAAAAAQTRRQRPASPTVTGNEPGSETAATTEGTLPIPPETKSETKHDWTAGGRAVHYTATAGNLLIKDDADKPIGSIFYVAYTEDGAPKNRPVTFLYNGGPGSATIWLHMGSVGPIRVVTESPKASAPAPFQYVPNQYSLIDKTDLVFIDAPMCGFSRAVGKGTAKDFAGVDQDVKAFEKFITRYITVNQRWNSPKYLFGESYGTPRSAALVAALNNDGIEFNGVTLLSSILNYYIRSPGYDLESITYCPQLRRHRLVLQQGQTQSAPCRIRRAGPQVRSRPLRRSPAAAATGFHRLNSTPSPQKVAGLHRPLGRNTSRVQAPHQPLASAKSSSAATSRSSAATTPASKASTSTPPASTPGYDPSDSGINGVYVGAFHEYLTEGAQIHEHRALLPAAGPRRQRRPGTGTHRASGGGGGFPGGRGGQQQPDVGHGSRRRHAQKPRSSENLLRQRILRSRHALLRHRVRPRTTCFCRRSIAS